MNRQQFLSELEKNLQNKVGAKDTEDALNYYNELFDDAEENGRPESEVFEGLPSPAAIAEKIAEETSGQQAHPEAVEIKSGEKLSFGKQMKADFTQLGRHIKDHAVNLAGKVKKERNIALLVFQIIGLVFFCAVAIPVIVALMVSFIAVVFALWASAVAIVVSGGAVIIFSFYAWITSGAYQVGLSFLAAGFILLGIGLFCCKGMGAAMKGFYKAIGAFARLIGKMFTFGGKKNEQQA